jgi:hypothetical protein
LNRVFDETYLHGCSALVEAPDAAPGSVDDATPIRIAGVVGGCGDVQLQQHHHDDGAEQPPAAAELDTATSVWGHPWAISKEEEAVVIAIPQLPHMLRPTQATNARSSSVRAPLPPPLKRPAPATCFCFAPRLFLTAALLLAGRQPMRLSLTCSEGDPLTGGKSVCK